MLGDHPVQRIIEDLIRHPDRSSYAELGTLFEVLNDPNDYGRYGVLRGTQYINGSLFAKAAKAHLEASELLMLKKAAEFDWRKVNPTIFGSLMEGCLGHDRQWEIGAHYTHEVNIMKNRSTDDRGAVARMYCHGQHRGCRTTRAGRTVPFCVLDPACGCGNFLYVAYRELRSLEYELKERLIWIAQVTGVPAPNPHGLLYYPLANLRGIDIEPTAVLIARVTLWMGQRQMIDRFGSAEPALPLVDLSGIQEGDALKNHGLPLNASSAIRHFSALNSYAGHVVMPTSTG